MSGFDLAELLPFYLDETDEHIAALNDALLRLEQDPTDAKALAEAFRMFHSIKGASVVMGFEPVNQLTHHLESLFDQFRSQEADARPAGARPDLPLPRRAARLPPRAPRRGAERRRPRGADPLVIAALETDLTGSAAEPRPRPSQRHRPSCPAANAEATARTARLRTSRAARGAGRRASRDPSGSA